MKIVQMLPALTAGDAVGNDALAIDGVIAQMGYETGIYAGFVQDGLRHRAESWDKTVSYTHLTLPTIA